MLSWDRRKSPFYRSMKNTAHIGRRDRHHALCIVYGLRKTLTFNEFAQEVCLCQVISLLHAPGYTRLSQDTKSFALYKHNLDTGKYSEHSWKIHFWSFVCFAVKPFRCVPVVFPALMKLLMKLTKRSISQYVIS